MIEFILQSGFWALLLTLGAYQLGLFLRKKTGLAICNPLLISAAVVIPVLLLTGLPNEGYQKGMDSISWLMTPCTVSLAIPLYTQMKLLKGKLPAVIAGAAAGALCSLLTVGLCCWALQMDNAVVISLLPKSVTTAIAMPLAENNGGIAPLTTAVVAITGVLGAVAGPFLCKLLRIQDPIARGVAYGTSSHVIGTTRACEESELTGAVSSLALMVSGILTAVLFPLIVNIM